MSSSPQKVEDTLFQSPINSEQAQNVYSSSNIDDTEISPESISVMARKESHRASERKRRERLSTSMNALDRIIRQTRKFANKKHVRLDKNSIIEHAIAYIKELQQLNALYSKRLEESNQQIQSLRQVLLSYQTCPLGSIQSNSLFPVPVVYPPEVNSVPPANVPVVMNKQSYNPMGVSSFDSLVKAVVGEMKHSS